MIRQLREFLDSHGIKYAVLPHSRAVTAQRIAASARIPGKEAAGAERAELANEAEFRGRFPAGTFTELVRMDYRGFERLVRPQVLRFGTTV